MSAQCYTNRRRVVAEASLRKTRYPGSIGLNNNPIYASINCKPDFIELTYLIKLCCRLQKQIPSSPEVLLILDSGDSGTLSSGIVDGGNAMTSIYEIIDGGNS